MRESKILTKSEADAFANSQRDSPLITLHSSRHNAFFFTNDHCFRLTNRALGLSGYWVACSTYIPMEVAPRPSLPDGIVYDAETYITIFHKGEKLIESEAELVALLNNF